MQNKLLNKAKKAFAGVTALTLLAGVVAFGGSPAKAAVLTDVTATPASGVSSNAEETVLTFTPVTAITNGTVVSISYDTAFTGGAALTNGDISITGTNITSAACSGFVAGYFTCTLTTSASVTTLVTVSVGNTNTLTNPATPGNYNWSVVVNIGGTGATYDYGAGLAYIDDENDVLVTALVAPTISMDLYQAGTTTLLANPNTCTLGVLSYNAINTCTYDVGVGTNNATGATLRVVAGGALTNGSHNFTDATGAITAGTEAYGFYISNAGSVFTASGSYGAQYQTVPTTVATFATSAAVSDKLTTGQHINVVHAATMGTSTPVGSYTQTVTYTAFTK